MRVLHVLGRMDRGGIETWLMHVLRHPRRQFQMDFLPYVSGAGEYDDEVRSFGSRILPCAYQGRPIKFAAALRRLLLEEGPYDVVHCHSQFFSGWVLKVAHRVGIQTRVAHSHLDSSGLDARAGRCRRLKLLLCRRWIDHHATLGLAASRHAAAALFGLRWETDWRWRVLHCGIDLSPFDREFVDRDRVRGELGIQNDAFVVGHVGRFHVQKNHAFLLDVAAEAARIEPRFRLLLVGKGELRAAVEAKAMRLGLLNRVTFAGSRGDVPRLMLGAMDAFVLPSLFEGLPIVGIEAQASGLPIVLSDAITPEIDIIPRLVKRLPLGAPAAEWAKALLRKDESGALRDRRTALRVIQGSSFNIEFGVAVLERAYLESQRIAGDRDTSHS